MAKIRIERGDDWQRTFVDGVCVDYGHDVDWRGLLVRLGIDFEVVWGKFAGRGRPDDTFTPDIGDK